MPCVVPNCDPKGQCFALHFPESYLLSQRWKQAIELGSGEALPEDVSPLEVEICQQHFCEFDEYGEPVIFWNKSQDREIRLSSCRLCLKFTLPSKTISNWYNLTLGEYTVKQLLKKVLQIDCDDSESLDCNICQQCLVRLDILATIYGQIDNDSKVWKKMQGLSKHERRAWDKISTQKKDPLTSAEKPTSSDAILYQVEIKQEEAFDDETEPTVIVQPVKKEDDVINHLQEAQKRNERTDEELPETSEVGNSPVEKPEQLLKSTTHKKLAKPVKPLKSSVKRQASDQKADKTAIKQLNRRKHKRRPTMDLRELINRKCYLCVVVFDSSDELLAHLLNHSDEDLVCGNCSEIFSSLPSYNRHLAKHDPNERPLQCNHCSLRYKDGRGLRVHEEMVHHIDHGGLSKTTRKEKVYTCQYCGKVFHLLHKLQSHEDKHTGKKSNKCKHCNKAFSSRQNLERHCMHKHTSVKPFKCDVCANTFRKSTSYEAHRKSCNPETIREISENGKGSNICRFCSDEFQKHSDLVDHVIKGHSNEKVHFLRCYLCKRKERFVEQYYYAVHMLKHYNSRHKNHPCRHCPKLCKSQMHRKAHESTHEEVQTLCCKHCSKTFTNSSNLARHQRIHSGVKPYQCDVCGKTFVQAAQLTVHSLIHTGERPFECQSCGKRFADRSTLSRHRKNVCSTV